MSNSIKILKRELLYTNHSRNNKEGIRVKSGEIFIAQTELCTGDWLGSIKDIYHPDKAKGPNPCVVAKIDDAALGDIIAISIIDIKVDKLGYTGFDSKTHALSQKICQNNWGINTKTLLIEDGYVIWNDRIRIPTAPMIGTLGTAPAVGNIPNSFGGAHGGNMDVNEVRAGSVVYLRSYVKGAMLHIGDVHAIQGDGEINGAGGVECRAVVKLKAEILKKKTNMKCVRIEDEGHIMTVACKDTTQESFYAAAGEMLLFMVEEYGFTEQEAYLLMGQVMEARCTQFVNPTRTYICKMPKRYLNN